MTDVRNEAGEVSRLEQSNVLGLAFVRTMILLNAGGILALMTFIGNASAQTAVYLSLGAIKLAMLSFLVGIASILLALLISYSATASAPETSYSKFWNKRIIATNATLALISLGLFTFGVAVLLCGGTDSLNMPIQKTLDQRGNAKKEIPWQVMTSS